jgi:hypothetical protein
VIRGSTLNQLFTDFGYGLRMDQSLASQNRNSTRSPVLLSAKIERNGNVQPVRLRNLSSEGALIEGDALPEQGAEIIFERKELRVRARIVWAEGQYAGVAFERRLPRDELLRHVPKPRQTFEQKYRRPGLACEPLSEADRRMVQLWANPISARD